MGLSNTCLPPRLFGIWLTGCRGKDKNELEKDLWLDMYDPVYKQDLMQDFVSLVTSFCARLYGLRRSQRKTEAIIKELKDNAE